ncbi:hypothetical protein [Shewanella sp. ALD9]|uniref:hypothetical protein n=1 Tax=Shewanella sp. ALD9 TaxID=2058330 RepID=UPI0012FE8430|nr:hypothetical protein [Shewanella sp. ALD9]
MGWPLLFVAVLSICVTVINSFSRQVPNRKQSLPMLAVLKHGMKANMTFIHVE